MVVVGHQSWRTLAPMGMIMAGWCGRSGRRRRRKFVLDQYGDDGDGGVGRFAVPQRNDPPSYHIMTRLQFRCVEEYGTASAVIKLQIRRYRRYRIDFNRFGSCVTYISVIQVSKPKIEDVFFILGVMAVRWWGLVLFCVSWIDWIWIDWIEVEQRTHDALIWFFNVIVWYLDMVQRDRTSFA